MCVIIYKKSFFGSVFILLAMLFFGSVAAATDASHEVASIDLRCEAAAQLVFGFAFRFCQPVVQEAIRKDIDRLMQPKLLIAEVEQFIKNGNRQSIPTGGATPWKDQGEWCHLGRLLRESNDRAIRDIEAARVIEAAEEQLRRAVNKAAAATKELEEQEKRLRAVKELEEQDKRLRAVSDAAPQDKLAVETPPMSFETTAPLDSAEQELLRKQDAQEEVRSRQQQTRLFIVAGVLGITAAVTAIVMIVRKKRSRDATKV